MTADATMRPTQGPRVVALGDSITLGVGDSALPGIGAGWAAHLAYAIGASEFTNLAANGTRARDLALTQVPTALMARPDVVLMTVGGNDVLRGDFSPAEITEHLRDALSRFERPGRQIVMISLDRIAAFSVLGRRVSTVMGRRIGLANAAISAAIAGTGVRMVDGAEVFARLGTSAWHVDRIHPSPGGHRALALEALRQVSHCYAQTAAVVPSGPGPSLISRAWWMTHNGVPWVAKRSRDLVPQVARVVTHELLEERRAKAQPAVPA
ncbi:SGNH/GDSL hydrolase family protein [Demequina sp. TTPB684]|uniref:SGNH/GDSL hydrolase family protein n=1 Tax=unclassified Demequina TaxID=2620311 RepID=UPI001CF45A28|nr:MULTISPECIES: SGNH/GDSL hydrolase family protein [unclassified Demequina]MCB2412738.1 SGNH/GDSL hydrolase family protein [Demequina sp. TTPB684]UPU88884.1 SGNH/GDSL hydrolase family protein [Demequina sp. TMPB413]